MVTPKGLFQPRKIGRRGGGFVTTGKSECVSNSFGECRKLLRVTGTDDKQQLDHKPIGRYVLLGALSFLSPHQHLTLSHFAMLALQASADVTCLLELVIPHCICITLGLSR